MWNISTRTAAFCIQPILTRSALPTYPFTREATRCMWSRLLSDYIDESEVGTTLEELKEKFEWGYYDIEHIHANCNEKEGTDIDGDLQNSIGNLMLLEYDINRSIGNLTFKEKKERGNNKLCYKNSRFAVVKKIMKKENWGKEEIEERRKEEIEKISRFIFE